jgi:CheY-like chemotaxis protein
MPPETEFTRQVADAYEHLYDLAYLRTHPLAAALSPDAPLASKERAWQLHRTLLGAIEDLNPGPNAPVFSHEWRRYRLLVLHYVDGQDPQSVADQLGISRRHYYREHSAAIEALASVLWQSYVTAPVAASASLAASAAGGPLPLTRLELLRLEAVRLVRSERYAQPAEIMQGAAALVQEMARSKGIHLRVNIDANLPSVAMDRSILRQVLLGLLSYMVEHLDQGDLQVGVGLQEGQIRVSLQGPRPVAGREGERQEDARAQIATLNELAELQGMQIQALSGQPGTFGFVLLLPRPTQRTILVVDDNEDVLQLFQGYLAQEHYRVLTAQTSAAAIRLSRERQPNAITLDLMMPDQDGWDILQILTNQPETQHIPVIICTVLGARDLALSLGASAFLEKPVTQQTLLATLRALEGD